MEWEEERIERERESKCVSEREVGRKKMKGQDFRKKPEDRNKF